ncbi:homoserine kinase [Candidatus Gracilibacteria bacterium]|nr:homoserine kinase [Candidatus Gracilibacteria bacterium]
MLDRQTIERVLANYPIGQLHEFRIAARGQVNETALIKTSMGRFVLRRNQRRLGHADLERRHMLLRYLQQDGFPAPQLATSHTGTTAVILDGRIYEISSFIDGDSFDSDTTGQVAAVGALLASYHRTVRELTIIPPNDECRYGPVVLLSLLERLLQRDMMGDLQPQLAWYDRRAMELRRLLPAVQIATLPHLTIHGDIHRDNVLFAAEHAVALIDFDQISYDLRLVDLVDALIAFASYENPPDWNPWGVYRGPLHPDAAATLINAYTAIDPLSGAERTALPLLIESAWLQGELRRVLLTPDGAPEYHSDVLEQGQALSAALNAMPIHVMPNAAQGGIYTVSTAFLSVDASRAFSITG